MTDVLSRLTQSWKIVSTAAYFSMEVGIEPRMPTYSGGLGVLAGDALRAAADLEIPMVGVTLLHRKGYFRQHLDEHGNQSESPYEWTPGDFLEPMEPRVTVELEGRPVRIRAWRYTIKGISGHTVPVFFLDTSLPLNEAWDRTLTDHLYGGDEHYRFCQETILGLGGVAMLRALGYTRVKIYHMNEGHSALLAVALLKERLQGRDLRSAASEDVDAVRHQCVFTTHTPVPAGHDNFPVSLVRQALGEEYAGALIAANCCPGEKLNMTFLALSFSRYVNGVAMRHGEVSRDMFPSYPINSVTNGVHAATWAAPSLSNLFDRFIPEWRRDSLYLRYAVSIPLDEILRAHALAKEELLAEVERRSGIRLERGTLTLGFARRAAPYKRADLLFRDLNRLRGMARNVGPLQIIYAGKAHPRDEGGKALIRRVFEAAASLKGDVPVVYLDDYDMALAKYMCSGVDIWLNTPQKPLEASGTSGMKAAVNGVPSLSVLDGWWVEGHVEGVTGWSIGDAGATESSPDIESASLYNKLEFQVVPLFYGRPMAFSEVMRSTIALNGSFFNAGRMMIQYLENAYQRLLQ